MRALRWDGGARERHSEPIEIKKKPRPGTGDGRRPGRGILVRVTFGTQAKRARFALVPGPNEIIFEVGPIGLERTRQR